MSSISDLLGNYITGILVNTFRKNAEQIYKSNKGPTSLKETYILIANAYSKRLDDNKAMSDHITKFLDYCARVDRAIRQEHFMKTVVREFCPPGIDQYTGADRDNRLGRKIIALAMRNSISRLIKSESTLDVVVNGTDVAKELCGKMVIDVIKSVRQDILTDSLREKTSGNVSEVLYNTLKNKYDRLVAEMDDYESNVADLKKKMSQLIDAATQLELENKSLKARLRERESVKVPTVLTTEYRGSNNVDSVSVSTGNSASTSSRHSRAKTIEDEYNEFDTDNYVEETTRNIPEPAHNDTTVRNDADNDSYFDDTKSSTSKSSRKSNRNKDKFAKRAQQASAQSTAVSSHDDNVSEVVINPEDSVSSVPENNDEEW